MKFCLFHQILETRHLNSNFIHIFICIMCLIREFSETSGMSPECVLVFSSFWYWSNLGVPRGAPYFYIAFLHRLTEATRFLLAFPTWSSFVCVNLEWTGSFLGVLLIYSAFGPVFSEQNQKFPVSVLVFSWLGLVVQDQTRILLLLLLIPISPGFSYFSQQ